MKNLTLTFAVVALLWTSGAAAQIQSAVTLTVLPERPELTRERNTVPYSVDLEFVVSVDSTTRFHPEGLTLAVQGDERPLVILEFNDDVWVTPSEPLRRAMSRTGREPAVWVATLSGRTESGKTVKLTHAFNVYNTDLLTAQAACQACKGEWGRYGMLGWEGCNCRTPDAGQRCIDGRDCQGRCMFQEFELVEEPKEPTCNEQGVCRASLGVRRAVGTCSEFEYVYGCHTIIRNGASDELPKPGAYRMSTICID